MRILADTSALIEFMRGNEVVKNIMFDADKIYVSSLSVFELLLGKDKNVLDFISSLDGVLSLTKRDSVTASLIYKRLKENGSLIGLVDILIASQAMNRKLTVLTKDKDFEKLGAIVNIALIKS
ncbi:PIN domain-containing protein [Sulfolobus sp. E5-1-F]|uniref:type II toxin-antitoxin system VapC family toxin n=1 Tax=Sulfolobaceae TaxID=118883 RepID=UPI0012957BFA|nr:MULTISPECIES: type II toxin-antitoxin system VapC family toxin [unclassified Sulfolobus]QGA54310.1 PIN domain-containing protein [Sulfolobus sp. E5-1-F]QGA69362.1 PIN domain-containing protein [Sulfolobus sp. E11-6]